MSGPPFTHPTLPHFAHYIGSTTPRSSPSHYLSAIQALLQSYRLDIQSHITDVNDPEDDRISESIPLVVNTMGWSKGLGADLTRKIEEMVEPTDIFEIEAPVFEMGWSAPHPSTAYPRDTRTHKLDPTPPSVLSTNYSPADHRTLSILSYFHAAFPPTTEDGELLQVSATSWNTSLPLCAKPPFEVDWTMAFDAVVLTGAGSEDVVSSEIKRVLNGAVVGLVACEPGTMDLDTTRPTSSIPYTQGSPIPIPSSSTCHGLALIRSISRTSPHMHILTPLPPHHLSKCRFIVKGELELPIWGMIDPRGNDDNVTGVEKGNIPYLQWGKGEGLGGEKRRVRRNLMRKGQM
jgi:polynucleotide 5'-hydroxyl-kinase GRC3/NOL9